MHAGDTPVLRQIWAMSAVYLIFLNAGLVSRNNVKREESVSNTAFLTWQGIFTVAGYLTSSLLLNRVGRRFTYIVALLPGIVNCLLINFHLQLGMLKAFPEVSNSATFILGLIIIGEYTSPKHRGILLNLTTAALNIGNIIGILLNHFGQRTIANASLILQVVALGITYSWQESPYWLASQEVNEDSKADLQSLWEQEEYSAKEPTYSNVPKLKLKTIIHKVNNYLHKHSTIDFKKAVTIVVFGAILAESSGRDYLPIFASKMNPISDNTELSELYTSGMIALSSVVFLILLRIFRHRTLLLTTGCISITFLFLASIYMFFSTHQFLANSFWIKQLLFNLFVIFSNFACTSVPMVLVGEILPSDKKAVGCFVAGVVTSVVNWLTMKAASCLLAIVHVYGTLAIFGLVMTVSLLFLMIVLPETKGKTLQEIHEHL